MPEISAVHKGRQRSARQNDGVTVARVVEASARGSFLSRMVQTDSITRCSAQFPIVSDFALRLECCITLRFARNSEQT